MAETGNKVSGERITFDKESTIAIEALFNSEPFRKRVTRMIRHLQKEYAESSFTVGIKNDTILFRGLQFGTRKALDKPDMWLGLDTASAKVMPEDLFRLVNHDQILTSNSPQFKLFAIFHSHPNHTGFSTADVSGRDYHIQEESEFVNRFRDAYTEVDRKLPYIEGLISPIRSAGGAPISGIHVLAFWGMPISTEYQVANFGRMSIEQQADFLRKNGFKVLFEELPVSNGTVDFSKLEHLSY